MDDLIERINAEIEVEAFYDTKQAAVLNDAKARIIALQQALERIATVDHGGGFLGAQACRKIAAAVVREGMQS